jgi:ADP-heptose:LPS heptosyltransferase
LFIANDSGLRQLAASLGVSSIGIFGPTGTEKNFAANGKQTALTADHVLCRPCHYTRWWLSCGGDQRCLSDITVEKVMAQVEISIQEHLKNDRGI